jgi:hypothetical protein
MNEMMKLAFEIAEIEAALASSLKPEKAELLKEALRSARAAHQHAVDAWSKSDA